MKKIGLFLFTFLLLCGCSQKGKYDDYERIDFVESFANMRAFNTDIYAVVDITEQTIMVGPGEENALVYQIGANEWILLDRIEGCGFGSSNIHRDSNYTYFYYDEKKNENKLFTVRGYGADLREYTLKEEKFDKKDLKFDTSSISSTEYLEGYKIKKVEDGFIYYDAYIHNSSENVFVKCSLENYVCELAD